ncbi:MAG: scaffolding protein [Gemmatimonadetes bacterium]|nr:scaffolding protein [Gemmatimonadota bacterium]
MAADVRFQPTPNPNAGKFSVGRAVVEGKASRSWYSAAQAASDPLAAELFAVDGVASLFMVEDFVTVTKRPDAQWPQLAPRVIAALQRALG